MEDQRRAEGAAVHRGGPPPASGDTEEGLRAVPAGTAAHRGGPPPASAPGRRTAAPRETAFEPDPVVEAYKRHVDRTLLRQNLRRSVTERVANLIALQRLAAEERRAGRVRERDR